MVKVDWDGDMGFSAMPESGNGFQMDAHSEFGGLNKGPTPIETLLGAIAGCSAMDVISILKKKQQKVTSYRVEVDSTRAEPGVFPRPIVSIVLRHIVSGENIDPIAVARAVDLSDNKYCTVIATLRQSPKITSEWRIDGEAAGTV